MEVILQEACLTLRNSKKKLTQSHFFIKEIKTAASQRQSEFKKNTEKLFSFERKTQRTRE